MIEILNLIKAYWTILFFIGGSLATLISYHFALQIKDGYVSKTDFSLYKTKLDKYFKEQEKAFNEVENKTIENSTKIEHFEKAGGAKMGDELKNILERCLQC